MTWGGQVTDLYFACRVYEWCLSCISRCYIVDAPCLGAWKGRQHQCHQEGGLCKTCDDLHHWLVLLPKQVPIKREERRHPAAAMGQ